MRLAAIFAAAALGLAGAAFAQQPPTPPPVLDQVYACAAVAGESERLACYDAAVGRLRQAQNTGEFVAVDRVQAEEIGRDAFGFSLPSLPRLFGGDGEEPLAEITLEIARIGRRSDGGRTFTMTNGQSWTQIDAAQSNSRARPGAQVIVRRAALGSYMMSLGGGQALRVRRQE